MNIHEDGYIHSLRNRICEVDSEMFVLQKLIQSERNNDIKEITLKMFYRLEDLNRVLRNDLKDAIRKYIND